ncbi:MAG: HAD hydrolase-like protein [Bryobacterales bacterium]|nr:HAD hydrolase-like protein [Bryobacterales bacterium]
MAPTGASEVRSFPAVFLFDIDGTLVRRAGPHHREALEYAVEHVLGAKASTEGIPVHGMLDTDIVTEMLRREGMPHGRIRGAMPDITHCAEERYREIAPGSLEAKRCPGSEELLAELQRRLIPMLLVTGNFPRIGWHKLTLAGLAHYFAHGAFAGMSGTRAGLARLAIRHARQQGWLNGRRANAESVVLVGDAPADIQAAHRNRIRSIAVSTGISTREELEEHRPHLLLASLSDLRLEDLGTP